MDTNLPTTAKAPMIALIKTKNIMKTNNLKTKTRLTFAALLLFALLAPTAVWAQFGGGNGSNWNPYIISTTDHLTTLANNVNGGNNYLGVYFRLDADLDYTGKTYTIIADYFVNGNNTFRGNFNGDGHTISGVTLDRTSTVGNSSFIALFGRISEGAIIENLTLSNSTIRGRIGVGGIVGGAYGASISNCHVTSDVTIETVLVQYSHEYQPVGSQGSIVGRTAGTPIQISDCTSAATIIATNDGNSEEVGGIVGCIGVGCEGSNVSGCIFTGGINFSGSSYVGGIVGEIYGNDATFTGNYIGSSCTIGAVGVEGSTQGTDEGYDVTRIATWRFATPQYGDGGTCITPPIVTVQGTDYWAAGQPVAFSELHTFGQTTAGKMWQFVAQTADFEKYTLLMYVDPDTTWAFTQPRKDVQIVTSIVKDINDTNNNYISVEVQDSAFFDGQGHRPEVKIWDGVANKGGRWLIEGMDYVTDIPAEGFTDEGEYTVTVWGIDHYGGRQTHTFRITMPWEGEGTMANPYKISSTDEMDALAHIVDLGLDQAGVYFRQTADLDYTGKSYMPVGRAKFVSDDEGFTLVERPFNGIYDGYGRTISNVTVSGEEQAGLFGRLGEQGELSNVVLSGTCSIEGKQSAGGIVGLNYGNISDCKPQSSNITVKGRVYVGGVVGCNSGGFVYAEECRANIRVTGISESPEIGGLVGRNNGGTVYGSFLGTITANKGNVGGIVGCNYSDNDTGCDVWGEMFGNIVSTGGCAIVGGIVGYNSYNCTVENCLSTCSMQSVSGATYASAIIGWNYYGTATNNYYLGANRYGGINGSDVSGQAMRGWPVTWAESLDLVVSNPSDGSMPPGVYYNTATNASYILGAGETLQFSLWADVGPATECYANEQHLASTMEDDSPVFTYTMPATPVYLSLAGNLTAFLDDDDCFRINAAIIEAKDGQTLDVKLRGRTFLKDGSWNLLAVPFALSDFSGTPLEGAEVRTIAVTSTYAGGLLTLDFTDPLTAIEAGKPYFVRWTSGDDITDPVFSNVTIENVLTNIEGSNVAFVPNYNKPVLTANTTANLYLGDDGQLHYPYNADYTLYAMRGHFEVDLGTTGVHVGNCVLNHGTTDTYPMLPAIFQAEGNWNDATKWNTGTVPDGGDMIVFAATTIPSGCVANAGQIIKDASIDLTIEDGGQLYHTGGYLRVSLEKAISAFDPQADPSDGWHLITLPFMSHAWVSEVENMTANEYDLYYYDEPTHYWINHKDTENNNQFVALESGKGYLYANSQAVTLGVSGWIEPGNAEVNIPLSYTTTTGELTGFNLIGNPFVHNVTSFTANNASSECFRLNDTKNELVVGTIDADHPLLPLEGVFVKATGDNASVTFNGQTRGEKSASGRIALELSQNAQLIDRLIVKQDGEPLEKFTLRENSTKLFATLDNQDMAVAIAEGNEQPVSFKAAKNGTYTLTVNVENMDLDYLHLIDNLTGADIDLLAVEPVETPTGGNGPSTSSGTLASYTFTAKTTDYESRFKLVFSADEYVCEPNEAFAYISNGNIVITTDMGDATLQIVDVMGRVVASYGGHTRCVSTSGMTAGVYVLRLIDGENVRPQKIVVE